MREDKIVGSFSPKSGDAPTRRGFLGGIFEKFKGVIVTKPDTGSDPEEKISEHDTSLGAKEAKRPSVAKKTEKPAVEMQKPSVDDLFSAYDGRSKKLPECKREISEIMRERIPSLDEISVILSKYRTGDKMYRAVEAAYDNWAEQLKMPVIAEAEKRKASAGEGELAARDLNPKRVKERISTYLNNYERKLLCSDNFEEARKDFFRLLEEKTNIRRKNLSPEDEQYIDQYLQGAISSKQKSEKQEDSYSLMTREGALESIEAQKKGIVRVIQESRRLNPRSIDKLLRRISIRVPERQKTNFKKLSGEDRDAVLESIDSANREIEEALRAQSSNVPKEKKETPEEKEMRIKREQADMEMTRSAASFTLHKINNYEELWANTKEESDKKFIKKTQKLWKEFAVHGRVRGFKDGKPVIAEDTDLDGKTSLGLLKMAGVDVSNLHYVHPGDYEEGRINIDTGGKHGVVFDEKTGTLFIDHHDPESGDKISSALQTYKILVGLGMLEKNSDLERLLYFVNHVDNWTLPDQKKYFGRSGKTILGLRKEIGFDDLLKLVKKGKNFTEILGDDEIEELGLEKASDEQKAKVAISSKIFEKLEGNGQVFSTAKYGRVVVSIAGELKGGYDAARFFDCDTIVNWHPKYGSFSVYSAKEIVDDFGEGIRVRDKMWLCHPESGKLKNSLGSLLRKMAGDDFQPLGELAEYLKTEANRAEIEKKKSEFKSDYEELYPAPERPKKNQPGTMENAVYQAQLAAGKQIADIEVEEKRKEREELLVELYQEFAQKFWVLFQKKAMAEFEKWGYNEKDRRKMLENQTRAYLERKMKEKNDFSEKRGESIDRIMETVSRATQV